MEIFKRKKRELPPLLGDKDLIDYHSVLEWLVGLSDEDYVKVMEVAGIHRKAYKDAAAVLGSPNEPSTFIEPPAEPETDEPAFLDHEPKSKKAKAK